MKQLAVIVMIAACSGFSLADDWEGTVNQLWNNAANWNDGTVPTATDNVYIPSGTPFPCWVSSADQACDILTITSGASLRIYDQVLEVNGYVITQGHLEMDHSAGELHVAGSVYCYNGSTFDISASSSEIFVEGNWYAYSGSDVVLETGYLEFNGSTDSEIYIRTPGVSFKHLRSHKDGAELIVHASSNYSFAMTGNLYSYTGSTFRHESSHTLTLQGDLNNQGGDVCFDIGELIMTGTSDDINLTTASYLNDLSQNASYTYLLSPVDIRGDLTLNSGQLVASGHDIEIDGNWTSNIAAGFDPGGNRVTFTGTYNQAIVGDEGFHELWVGKPASSLIIFTGSDVTTASDLYVALGGVMMFDNSRLEIGGELQIYDGAWLDADGVTDAEILVGSNWADANSISPGFTPGSSTVTFFGSDQWQYLTFPNLTGYVFHNVIIDKDFGSVISSTLDLLFTGDFEILDGGWSSSYNAGIEHTIRGDLTLGDGTSFNDDNTVRFYGNTDQWLHKDPGATVNIGHLEVDKPGGTLTLDAWMLNVGGLTIEGVTDLNGTRLWTDWWATISAGGYLQVDAGAQLMLDQYSDLTVESGGTLELVGTPALHAVLSGTGPSSRHYAAADILSGGTLIVRYADIQRLNVDGLHIHPGATVDPVDPFRECVFEISEGGATLLWIDNNQELVTEGVSFIDSYYGTTCNVRKTVDEGRITFNNFQGNLAGQLYEDDPFDRIDWFGPLIPVWNLTIDYQEATGEVLLEWDYHSNVDHYNIYRSNEPLFTPSPVTLYDTTPVRSYLDAVGGTDRYFYRVTADRAE